MSYRAAGRAMQVTMNSHPTQTQSRIFCLFGGVLASLLFTATSTLVAESRRLDQSVYETEASLKELMPNMVFGANFENSAEPDIGSPAVTVHKEYGDAPGIVGKAFLSKGASYCQYPTSENLDFSKPGALSFWVSAHEWSWGDDQPIVLFFSTPYKASGYLGIERQGAVRTEGRTVRQGGIVFFVQGFPNTETELQSKVIFLAGTTEQEWSKDVWHFFVLNWEGSVFNVSMDGGPLRSLDIGRALEPQEVKHFRIGESAEPTLIDEFMIYRRPLNEGEIANIYQALHR
jgi:hypothetical protein